MPDVQAFGVRLRLYIACKPLTLRAVVGESSNISRAEERNAIVQRLFRQ